jgi:hypothetical protein
MRQVASETAFAFLTVPDEKQAVPDKIKKIKY